MTDLVKAESFDVVVVGGGPAGSVTAASLARAGWTVALVDENETPRRSIICSGIVGTEAYRRFELPHEAIVDRIAIGRFISPAGVQVTHRPSSPPLAYVVDRTVFDAALADRAQASGAEVRRGHSARTVRRTGGRIQVRTHTREGPRGFRARALVVATGHKRWLHGPADLGRAPGYVQGVHSDLPFDVPDGAEVHFGRVVAPGFFAWVVPFGEGRARLGILASGGARRLFRDFVESPRVRPRLRDKGVLRDGGLEADLLSRGIVQGAVRPSFADRCVAVGEAAGQVKTTTAGGIYYGLIGARLAAETLDEGLRRDRLDASSLRRYETAWIDVIGDEIEAGFALQRLGRELRDREVDRAFEALSDGLGSAVRRFVRFDWHRVVIQELLRDATLRRFVTDRVTGAGIGA